MRPVDTISSAILLPSSALADGSQPNSHLDTLTPFRQLISMIAYLPFKWRKLLLNACRIQQPILLNNTLKTEYANLEEKSLTVHYQVRKRKFRSYRGKGKARFVSTDRTITLLEIIDIFENIHHSPILCTALSYFCRAEQTFRPDEFIAIRLAAIIKEFMVGCSI
jgi:hypothetical protein